MTDRINLVDAYSNRSVVAKLARMEDEINGAQDSISQQTEEFTGNAQQALASIKLAGETAKASIDDSKSDVVYAVNQAGRQAVADVNSASASGVQQVQDLLDGLDATVAKAEAAAATAEQASKTADEASDKAEAAAKSVDDDVIAAANAVVDAKAYATTGILHDGTAVTSADAIEKQCETIASQVSGYTDSAKQYRDSAYDYAVEAQSHATSAETAQSACQVLANETKNYQTQARTAADEAKASATSAGTYAGECLTYNQACAGAKTTCETAQATATTKATEASQSATASASSATSAGASATAAAASATEAKEAAASIDTSNFVDLDSDQVIHGPKRFYGATIQQEGDPAEFAPLSTKFNVTVTFTDTLQSNHSYGVVFRVRCRGYGWYEGVIGCVYDAGKLNVAYNKVLHSCMVSGSTNPKFGWEVDAGTSVIYFRPYFSAYGSKYWALESVGVIDYDAGEDETYQVAANVALDQSMSGGKTYTFDMTSWQ